VRLYDDALMRIQLDIRERAPEGVAGDLEADTILARVRDRGAGGHGVDGELYSHIECVVTRSHVRRSLVSARQSHLASGAETRVVGLLPSHEQDVALQRLRRNIGRRRGPIVSSDRVLSRRASERRQATAEIVLKLGLSHKEKKSCLRRKKNLVLGVVSEKRYLCRTRATHYCVRNKLGMLSITITIYYIIVCGTGRENTRA